jgi:nitrogenase-stabilizing/protective protein
MEVVMSDSELEMDMEELVSAEDFLAYFDIPFDQHVVHVNRLHILQRFHDYVSAEQGIEALDEEVRWECYRNLLTRAYEDFVASDALTEKVFKVFHMHEPQTTIVPLDQLFK